MIFAKATSTAIPPECHFAYTTIAWQTRSYGNAQLHHAPHKEGPSTSTIVVCLTAFSPQVLANSAKRRSTICKSSGSAPFVNINANFMNSALSNASSRPPILATSSSNSPLMLEVRLLSTAFASTMVWINVLMRAPRVETPNNIQKAPKTLPASVVAVNAPNPTVESVMMEKYIAWNQVLSSPGYRCQNNTPTVAVAANHAAL
mmetsp:Transcript_39481/g.113528  ORF Transcript_39481/g.113528 Transcript_39481/m.113528 type:complete len:203 (-) Transcript_39481:764-1372(-)